MCVCVGCGGLGFESGCVNLPVDTEDDAETEMTQAVDGQVKCTLKSPHRLGVYACVCVLVIVIV